MISDHNQTMDLRDRLREAREAAGLTQEQLRARAGLKNQSIIGSLESGYRKSSSYLPQIADALGVSAIWLSTGKGHQKIGGIHPPDVIKEQLTPRQTASTDDLAYLEQLSPARAKIIRAQIALAIAEEEAKRAEVDPPPQISQQRKKA